MENTIVLLRSTIESTMPVILYVAQYIFFLINEEKMRQQRAINFIRHFKKIRKKVKA